MLAKLVQHDSSAEQELVEIFTSIDNKCSIDLRNLTDSYVQLKLHKVFKLLRLQHTKQNLLEFKKRTSTLHKNMSLAKLIRHLIKKGTEKKPESEPDDSSISDISSS